MLKFKKKNRC